MKLTQRLIVTASAAAISLCVLPDAALSAQDTRSGFIHEAPNGAPMSFASLIERVSPAVVSIEAQRQSAPRNGDSLSQVPPQLREFFERFGEGVPQPQPRELRSQGSGFFISADGYVVTNNHVISGADTIRVVLTDGRSLEAEVVGTDSDTDLALLRVETEDGPFDFVELARDLDIRVGDWVVAVGNPFGLGGTATAGIVSATGRQMGASQAYTDFLQIDAPINRGNSGGPAFDLNGEVVGVNSAIISPTGGNVGIGFAIPSDLAATVIDQLIENGEVRRGYLGIAPAILTADIKDAMGLDEDIEGVLINQVLDDTPAQAAGLENGDVIIAINREPVDDPLDLTRRVGAFAPGERVTFRILRDDRERNIRVTLAEREGEASPQEQAPAELGVAAQFGLSLEQLTDEDRERLGLDDYGFMINGVLPGSEAAEKGLRPGDVILEVGHNPFRTMDDFESQVAFARENDRRSVLLFVLSQGGQRGYVPLLFDTETESEN